MAQIGRFHSAEGVAFPRGARVIVRTRRGLETGQVLSDASVASPDDLDGQLLRGMTVEDDLLDARLSKNRHDAYEACASRIDRLGLPVALMDVEHLFDGQTLLFYFLGEITPELDAITGELTELYETKVQFREFAEAVEQGCGPGCGTEQAEGAGCGSCSTGCTLASACGTRKAT